MKAAGIALLILLAKLQTGLLQESAGTEVNSRLVNDETLVPPAAEARTACRAWESAYNVKILISWGRLPHPLRLQWTAYDCNALLTPTPATAQSMCAAWANEYGVRPWVTWGSLPSDLQYAWLSYECDNYDLHIDFDVKLSVRFPANLTAFYDARTFIPHFDSDFGSGPLTAQVHREPGAFVFCTECDITQLELPISCMPITDRERVRACPIFSSGVHRLRVSLRYLDAPETPLVSSEEVLWLTFKPEDASMLNDGFWNLLTVSDAAFFRSLSSKSHGQPASQKNELPTGSPPEFGFNTMESNASNALCSWPQGMPVCNICQLGKCVPAPRRRLCASFNRSTINREIVYVDNGNSSTMSFVFKWPGAGSVNGVAHTRKACFLRKPCFEKHQCRLGRPMLVYIYPGSLGPPLHSPRCWLQKVVDDTPLTIRKEHMLEAWARSLANGNESRIEITENPNDACLLIVGPGSFTSRAALVSNSHWNGGKNHFIWLANFFHTPENVSPDHPVAIDFGKSSLAATSLTPFVFREGFDMQLSLHPLHKFSLAELTQRDETCRPRGVLLSFRGNINPWKQPYYQVRPFTHNACALCRLVLEWYSKLNPSPIPPLSPPSTFSSFFRLLSTGGLLLSTCTIQNMELLWTLYVPTRK
jgi:hypothetical protein